jgi:ATP-binding cassette subfamily B (MDR/TAP) protein 1
MGLGLIYPIFSVFLGNIINALFYLADPKMRSQGRIDANRAALAFLLLAIGVFIFQILRDYLTYVVGDEVTTNIRKETFQKMLKMPIYWFDKPDNNTGILSTRLGTDCQTINGMSTTYIYIMIQSLTTLVAGIILALVFEWRTALVSIGAMPLVMLAGYIRSKFRAGIIEKEDEAYKDSAQIIMESLTNVRTVVSFGV